MGCSHAGTSLVKVENVKRFKSTDYKKKNKTNRILRDKNSRHRCLQQQWSMRNNVSDRFPRILWNPSVHYRVHNNLVPILRQTNPIHAIPFCYRNVYFSVILSSKRGSSQSGFLTKTLCAFIFSSYLLISWIFNFFSCNAKAQIGSRPPHC